MGKIIANNKKARYDFEILETVESGIVLFGSELKPIRNGRVSIVEGYAKISRDEIFLENIFIAKYDRTNYKFNHEEKRQRKLLMHKKQIKKLGGKVKQGRLTLIPLKMYFNEKGFVKVLIGLTKGRKKIDKREYIKQKDIKRQYDKDIKGTL